MTPPTSEALHELTKVFRLTVRKADGDAAEVEPDLAFRRLAGFARDNPDLFDTLEGPFPWRIRRGTVRGSDPLDIGFLQLRS